jgi:hypothetical protein
MYYQDRFPPTVTQYHHNRAIRHLARQINRSERNGARAHGIMTMALDDFATAIKAGNEISLEDKLSTALSGMVAALATRSACYEALGEVIGNEAKFKAFLAEYPPKES